MKTRFIREIGTRATLRVYWGEDCPSCLGGGKPGYHNAHAPLLDSAVVADWSLGGKVEDFPAERWPAKCDHCTAVAPADATRQVFHDRLYDTPSGKPEPGDVYFTTYEHDGAHGRAWCGWENCAGPHLHVVLPNRTGWDVDSRASNCTMPTDRTHRCWVRRGDPSKGEPVHVDKGGHTCAAGAGSIDAGGWHGFLHHGELRSC